MQTAPAQYLINKIRGYAYPWFYGPGSFEADEIIPGLWLGNWASAHDIQALKDRNITHIVSAVYDIDPIYPSDFHYMKIPIIDKPDHAIKIGQHFDNVTTFIKSGLNNGGVLVHCVYGISRSSTLICAFLMHHKKMSIKNAIKYVQTKRPIAQPNIGFLSELMDRQ